jgi:hypothetical protein
MPNGRPGDHPLTDVVLHQAEIYGRDIDDLIREVAELSRFAPFRSMERLLWDAQGNPSVRPKLKRRLEKARARLEGRWMIG